MRNADGTDPHQLCPVRCPDYFPCLRRSCGAPVVLVETAEYWNSLDASFVERALGIGCGSVPADSGDVMLSASARLAADFDAYAFTDDVCGHLRGAATDTGRLTYQEVEFPSGKAAIAIGPAKAGKLESDCRPAGSARSMNSRGIAEDWYETMRVTMP
jgi:hypothetical protein